MRSGKMSEKQFKIINELGDYHLLDGDEELCYDLCSSAMAKENWDNVVEKLNELNTEREYLIGERGKLETKNVLLRKENEQLRLELETHKHPLWSTREAEKKVNKLADSLADEFKKNGLLNEEINQLRIENMRLKKKGGDGDMTNKRFIFVDNIFKYLDTGIKDNKSDYDSLNGESVVDLLNELVEENEQLRKQVAEYELILRQHEFAEKEGFQ